MSDKKSTLISFPEGKSDWEIELENPVTTETGIICDTFVLRRKDNRFFWLTFLLNKGIGKDGSVFEYWLPRLFEVGNGQKIGDVVVQFRKGPDNRWYVDVEEEFFSIDPKTLKKSVRIKRSSLDNIVQSVKNVVKKSGEFMANTQRIGGEPIFSHCVEAGWSPQKKSREELMDIFEFVSNSMDAIGKATILNAFQHLPTAIAEEIALQVIHPAKVN